MKQRQRTGAGERRQRGLPGGDIDRRAGQHQFAHLGGKPRGIEQRQPAALTEPDQIDQAAEPVDQHVERRRDSRRCPNSASLRSPTANRSRTAAAGRHRARPRPGYGRERHRQRPRRAARMARIAMSATPSLAVLKSRKRTLFNSSAIVFGVAHAGSARRRTVVCAHCKTGKTLGQQRSKITCRGCGKCRPHKRETRI